MLTPAMKVYTFLKDVISYTILGVVLIPLRLLVWLIFMGGIGKVGAFGTFLSGNSNGHPYGVEFVNEFGGISKGNNVPWNEFAGILKWTPIFLLSTGLWYIIISLLTANEQLLNRLLTITQ